MTSLPFILYINEAKDNVKVDATPFLAELTEKYVETISKKLEVINGNSKAPH